MVMVAESGSNVNEKVVIVGAGHAGVSVAYALRNLGYVGSIVLVGAESDFPYQRPALSKSYMTGPVDAEPLLLKQKELYERERITLLLDRRVTAINRPDKQVELEGGDALDYETLVLATGAMPRRLGTEVEGGAQNIYTLRNLFDAKRLRKELTVGNRLLVVGGGYIGLEIAAVARSVGVQITLLEQGSRILGRVAAAETAAYFRELHQEKGVELREGVGLLKLEHRNNRVVAALLADGTTLDVDAVVVGIGVVPETHLAAQAGLQIDNGIIVDGAGRTDDPAVYAVGDCANFPYQDRRVRVESVPNAIEMATTVARSILGESVHYSPVPWFWSDQYATKLQIAGLNTGYTRVAVRKLAKSRMSFWYYDNQRLIAVDAINDPLAFMMAKRWLGMCFTPSFEHLADTSIELNAMPSLEKNALVS